MKTLLTLTLVPVIFLSFSACSNMNKPGQSNYGTGNSTLNRSPVYQEFPKSRHLKESPANSVTTM